MINKKLRHKFIRNIHIYSIQYDFQNFGIHYNTLIDDYISLSNYKNSIDYDPIFDVFCFIAKNERKIIFCYNIINMFFLSSLWVKYDKYSN